MVTRAYRTSSMVTSVSPTASMVTSVSPTASMVTSVLPTASTATSTVVSPSTAASKVASLSPIAAPVSIPSPAASKKSDVLSTIATVSKYAVPLLLGITGYLWYNKIPEFSSSIYSNTSSIQTETFTVASTAALSPYTATSKITTSSVSFPATLNLPVFGPEPKPIPSEASIKFSGTIDSYLSLSDDIKRLLPYTDTYKVTWKGNEYNVGLVRLQTDGKGTNLESEKKIPVLLKASEQVNISNTKIIYKSSNDIETCPFIYAPGTSLMLKPELTIDLSSLVKSVPTIDSSSEVKSTKIIPDFVLGVSNLIKYVKNFKKSVEPSFPIVKLSVPAVKPNLVLEVSKLTKYVENLPEGSESIPTIVESIEKGNLKDIIIKNFDSFKSTKENDIYVSKLNIDGKEGIYFDNLNGTKEVITKLKPTNLTEALASIETLLESSYIKGKVQQNDIIIVKHQFKHAPRMVEFFYETAEKVVNSTLVGGKNNNLKYYKKYLKYKSKYLELNKQIIN
jgi:hypothetical protein